MAKQLASVVKQEDETSIELTTEPAVVVKLEEKPDFLTSYLDNYRPPEVVSLAATLNELYNHLWSGLTDHSRRVELRDQLKSIIDGRLDRFSEIFELFQVKEIGHAPAEEPSVQPALTSEPSCVQPMTVSEQCKSVSESSRNAVNMLAEKKKKCAIEELVKVPYEDHTYAISASSISLALQSSNIFNQNNAQGSNNGKLRTWTLHFHSPPTDHWPISRRLR